MDWAGFNAGELPKPEYVSNGKFNEYELMESRDKQLSILLAQESIDNEDVWINYEYDETQVKICITDEIVEILATECAMLLKK